MAGKSDTFEADILKLIFNATAIPNIADNAASAPLTNLYVSLHTADPVEVDNQTTNEITTTQYQNYARAPVARTTGGWAVSGTNPTQCKPVAAITFLQSGAGSTGATITHAAVGTLVSGAGKILYSGPVTPNIAITAGGGVTPSLATTSAIEES